jgi:ENTH domain
MLQFMEHLYKVRRDLISDYLADYCGVQSQALQLLEYLVKCGSDRVVDDARSHIPNSQRYCGGPGVPMVMSPRRERFPDYMLNTSTLIL